MGNGMGRIGRALLAALLALALLTGLPSPGRADGGEFVMVFDGEMEPAADEASSFGDDGIPRVEVDDAPEEENEGGDAPFITFGDGAEASAPDVEAEEAPPAPVWPADITITAVGDCTLGGTLRDGMYQRFAAVAKKFGPDYFFSNVRTLFEKDDLTIVNLEGPLTTAKHKRKGQWYCFKGPPAYVKILSGSSVEICNVANNHSLDYGVEGLKQTARVLEEAGIGCSGYSRAYTTTVKGVRVTSLGFTKWDHTPAKVKKAVARARKDCDLLLVSMHWGWEKQFAPDKHQKELGRAAVDAGADLVIGTHTHVYGGVEKYKGKYIVYSLGNFCFGGNMNPRDKRCLIFQQTLRYSPAKGVQDAGINIIPARVTSTSGTNDYRPSIMKKKDGLKLLKAVARVSIHMKKALWMPDGYLTWVGAASKQKLEAARDRALGVQAEPPAAEDFFSDAGGGKATADALFLESDE